jgi:adiponectin receptor
MLNNKYIHRGYRINHTSYKNALLSLFTVHNESVNVWTHFVGFKVFVGIIVFLVYFKQ